MALESSSPSLLKRLRAEVGLFAAVVTALAFMWFGAGWLSDVAPDPRTAFFFAWIFGSMMWASFGVVRHAEALAIKLGEPYGTLILTLSVITIEVALIAAVGRFSARRAELQPAGGEHLPGGHHSSGRLVVGPSELYTFDTRSLLHDPSI